MKGWNFVTGKDGGEGEKHTTRPKPNHTMQKISVMCTITHPENNFAPQSNSMPNSNLMKENGK